MNKVDEIYTKFSYGDKLSDGELRLLISKFQEVEKATIGCGLLFKQTFLFVSDKLSTLEDIKSAREKKQ